MTRSTCSHDAKDVVLLFYGELPDERVADVRARLSFCSSCRDVLTGLETIGEAVPRRSTVQIEDDALEAIRRSTAGKLRRYGREAESNRRGAWSGLFLRPALAGPAIALLAVIAFMIGFSMRPDLDVLPQTASTEHDLMYVSDISMNDDGSLAITYAATSEETVRGTLDDPLIQRLLGRALTDATDPVTRLRAANVIADIETGGSMRTDPDLTFALATVLAEENNTGLRLQAMQAAANLHPALPLPDVMVDVLARILQTEANSALRIQALRLLVESEIASMELASILESARDDSNSFVRRQAAERLQALGETVPLEQIGPESE